MQLFCHKFHLTKVDGDGDDDDDDDDDDEIK